MFRCAALGRALLLCNTKSRRPLPTSPVPDVVKPAPQESFETFRDVRQRKPNETLDEIRRRLRYQATYRGMVEMDSVLGAFADKFLPTFSVEECHEFDKILACYDNDLNNWLVMATATPAEMSNLSVWTVLVNFLKSVKPSELKN